MSVIAAAVSALIEAGVSGDALVAAIAKMEAAQAACAAPVRTARQERNARYYEGRKARLEASKTSEAVLIKTIETVSDDEALQKESPHTPKKNYPLSNSTASASAKRSKRQKPEGILCPDDFCPSEAHRAKCRDRGVPEALADTVCRKMHNWSHTNADRDIAWKADWSRALHGMLDDEIEKHLRQQVSARASPTGSPPSRNGALSRVASILGIEDEQPRTPTAERNFGPVIDHEGYGRPDRQIHEPAGGQAGRLPAQNHLRAVGSGWR
jgi:hypothetical protein